LIESFAVKRRCDVYMSGEGQKHALEEKRRRLRSQGRDLDIVDKVRLQRERREREAWKQERETGDIYDDKQRGEMLEADVITAAENAFMQGRKKADKRQKRDLSLDGKQHDDSSSV
jgi:hypothetical protein